MFKRAFFILIVLFVFTAGFPAFAGESPKVTLRGKPVTLLGESLQVGKALPDIVLPDLSLKMIDLKSLRGKVTILSVVPSLDTPTCEKQTHILSEENGGLDTAANLVTISRDLPFAQQRFSKGAKIENLTFLSDYREGGFGWAVGLLIDESRLLSRAVIVLDREGIVRYLEVVPELTQLPKMQEAFEFARTLL